MFTPRNVVVNVQRCGTISRLYFFFNVDTFAIA